MAATMRSFIDLLAKKVPLWAVLVVFFKEILSLLLWPSVKYMHHPFTSISPAFLVVFFTKNDLWGEFEWWKFWNVANVSILIWPWKTAKINNPKTDFSHGLFKEQFYKQKWESIRSAQAFFTGWGSFVLDDGITRILYGGLKDFLCRKVICLGWCHIIMTPGDWFLRCVVWDMMCFQHLPQIFTGNIPKYIPIMTMYNFTPSLPRGKTASFWNGGNHIVFLAYNLVQLCLWWWPLGEVNISSESSMVFGFRRSEVRNHLSVQNPGLVVLHRGLH